MPSGSPGGMIAFSGFCVYFYLHFISLLAFFFLPNIPHYLLRKL